LQDTLFSDSVLRPIRWDQFLATQLGQLYEAMPFEELAKHFPKVKDERGRKSWFSVAGALGLMVLKSYLGLSDAKLIERINTDWALQMFCGIQLKDNEQIRDKDIISRWRRFFGKHMNWEVFQGLLIEHWKPFIEQQHVLLMDATCFESHLRYPTDAKLVWECNEYVHRQINLICRVLKTRRPRNKYKEQHQKQLNYSRLRRKSHKKGRQRRRSLLYLLNKQLQQLESILDEFGREIKMPDRFYKQLRTVKKVYAQQKRHFDYPDEKVTDRIVSIHKDYIRPIVRGKENKRVEFGAKAHLVQLDGITLVDHLSFDAFNESTRLKLAVWNHRKHFGKCTQLGADQIYATNANRKYCTHNGIHTCFKRKGRASKNEDQAQSLRKVIASGRATVMEGSFGNQKNHYGLRKIYARTKATEIILILFGIWTADAVLIGKRKAKTNTAQRVA